MPVSSKYHADYATQRGQIILLFNYCRIIFYF